MMKINVKSVHFHADAKLISFVEKKISGLNRYFDRAIHAEVHLKLQDTGSKVQEKLTEIRLHIPGNDLMDKKEGKTFEEAITASYNTLKRQLVKAKEKKKAHHVSDSMEEDV